MKDFGVQGSPFLGGTVLGSGSDEFLCRSAGQPSSISLWLVMSASTSGHPSCFPDQFVESPADPSVGLAYSLNESWETSSAVDKREGSPDGELFTATTTNFRGVEPQISRHFSKDGRPDVSQDSSVSLLEEPTFVSSAWTY
ncbi:hypothetical protein PFLUV_G00091450 [Perca fluviatilis]|uniref:Uncharacterized protein n=1 Tax=Perca fluviatilis TaxID=8168 RepID=A0A6A5EH16_PERFL|nr:hypothetical protein PFLUV_G00091450 [Perca fluviatilis]